MTRTAEAQARRLLWVFPRWMRAGRGEETVGLVLDQLPSGAARLPLRSRLDLVRSGLHARRRGTPPPSVWAEVLTADLRNRRGLVPEAWRPWLLQWVHDPRWRRRYTIACLLVLVTLLFVAGPIGAMPGDVANIVFNLVLWVTVFGFFFRSRAARWRWSVALRNGLVPNDLRPFPADATQPGFVRPILHDRPALPLAAATTAIGTVVLGANVVVTALVAAAGRGSAGPSPRAFVTLVEAAVIGLVFLRPALRRIGAAPPQAPCWPDPESMVPHLMSRRSQVAYSRLLAILVGVCCWIAGSGGTPGAVLVGTVTLAAGCETWSIARRQRQIGRALGMWEMWPATGPRPLLLIRQDVLEAEDLRGPSVPRSQQPDWFA